MRPFSFPPKLARFAVILSASVLAYPAPALAGPRKANALTEAPSCGEKFGQLKARDAKLAGSSAADEIAKLIDKRFAGVDLTWIEGKKRPARLEKFYRNLLALAPKEKEALLARLREAFPQIEEAPLLARIGLNEEGGWREFFRETSGVPTHQPLMIGELRPFVEGMPEPVRRELLREIGEAYPTAGKVPDGTKSDGKYWPKRLLDGWLRVLLKGDEKFREGMAAGKTPIAAYQAYLDDVKGLVFAKTPGSEHYGELKAEELLGIAKEMRAFLRLPSTKKHLYQTYRDDSGKELAPVIRIFGSTVKGTSRKGSDLDLGYGQLNFNFVAGGERMGEQVTGLAEYLRDYLAKHHGPLALNAEGKPHFVGSVDEGLTALEPFMIEVSPDSVELLVFPREIEARKLPFRKGPPVYQAPAPVRYRLD